MALHLRTVRKDLDIATGLNSSLWSPATCCSLATCLPIVLITLVVNFILKQFISVSPWAHNLKPLTNSFLLFTDRVGNSWQYTFYLLTDSSVKPAEISIIVLLNQFLPPFFPSSFPFFLLSLITLFLSPCFCRGKKSSCQLQIHSSVNTCTFHSFEYSTIVLSLVFSLYICVYTQKVSIQTNK